MNTDYNPTDSLIDLYPADWEYFASCNAELGYDDTEEGFEEFLRDAEEDRQVAAYEDRMADAYFDR